MESLYFLIPLFFIIILIIPLNIKTKICLNFNKKKCYISLFLWKLKISTIKVILRENKLFVSTQKKKKEIELSLSVKQIYFIDQFLDNTKDKVIINKVSIFSRIGTNDAFSTAMFCGSLTSIYKCIFSFLKNKKNTASFSNITNPSYEKKMFITCLYISLKINLFDLLYCFVISLFGLRRKIYERNYQ